MVGGYAWGVYNTLALEWFGTLRQSWCGLTGVVAQWVQNGDDAGHRH